MPTSPLWTKIDPPLANDILLCAQETQKKVYKAALDIFSKQMGLRPNKILEMPKIERHRVWQLLLAKGHLEALSFNLISNWLMQTQTPMLCLWLDSLGVPHNGKGVTDTFPECPSADKLQASVHLLVEKFPPLHVAIYLHAFNDIDGVGWTALDKILEADPRLSLT